MKNNANKNFYLTLALLSTFITLGIHIYLTKHFYDLKFGTGEGNSICNINATFNCDTVTASKYASFLGTPIALWGLVTNLVLFWVLAITRFDLVHDRARVSRYGFLLSCVVMLGSIVMGGISATALGTYCIFCMTAYALSLLTFFGAWKGSEGLERASIARDVQSLSGQDRWLSFFLVGIPVVSLLANGVINSQFSDITNLVQSSVASWSVAPQQTFDPNQGLVLKNGTGTPTMILVEFADFRCPHCKAAAPTLHTFVNTHANTELIYKPFPLDGTCNTALKGNGGDGISCGLAFAVFCAEKIAKKGWAAHDFLFENQMDIADAHNLDKNIADIAKNLGIKEDELKSCISSTEIVEQVRKMAEEGGTAKIEGTPSIFVNGKFLNGAQFMPVLEGAYHAL